MLKKNKEVGAGGPEKGMIGVVKWKKNNMII